MYRVTTKLNGVESQTPFGNLNDALRAGGSFLEMNCPSKRDRTGSLKAHGYVALWKGGKGFGKVSIERNHPLLGWVRVTNEETS